MMRIDKGHSVKIKTTADDIRCFLIVGDSVWCGQRNGTIQILDRKVKSQSFFYHSLLSNYIHSVSSSYTPDITYTQHFSDLLI